MVVELVAVLGMVEVAAVEGVEVVAFAVAAAVEEKQWRARMPVFLVVGMVVALKIFSVPPHIAAVLAADEDAGERFDGGAASAVAGVAVGGAVEDAAGGAAYAGGVEGDVADAAEVQSGRIVDQDFDVDGGFLAADLVYAAEDHVDGVADRVPFEDCTAGGLAHKQIGHWQEGREGAVVQGSFVFVEHF